jgi:hypothetical protein
MVTEIIRFRIDARDDVEREAILCELRMSLPEGCSIAEPRPERPIEPHNDFPDPEQEWERFWKEIVAPNGVVNLDQLKKELADYSFLMSQASLVYCHVANLSKVMYHADVIISESDNHVEKEIEDAIKEARDEWEDGQNPPLTPP